MGFWTAWEFLTTLPSPARSKGGNYDFGSALPFFPVIGLVLGIILWLADIGLARVVPLPVASLLLLGLLVVLTGAIHIDGFIDSCDGLAARRTPEQRLQIMADSRVGAFGVVGGSLILLLQFAALSSLTGPVRGPALVLMPVIARWSMVFAVYAFPYVRGTAGKGHVFKQAATRTRTLVTLAICLGLAALATLGWKGPALAAACFCITVLVCLYVRSRLGGLTGDSYGAVNEIAQASVLIIIPLFWRI